MEGSLIKLYLAYKTSHKHTKACMEPLKIRERTPGVLATSEIIYCLWFVRYCITRFIPRSICRFCIRKGKGLYLMAKPSVPNLMDHPPPSTGALLAPFSCLLNDYFISIDMYFGYGYKNSRPLKHSRALNQQG